MSRWGCALSMTSLQRMEGPADLALEPTAITRPRLNAQRCADRSEVSL